MQITTTPHTVTSKVSQVGNQQAEDRQLSLKKAVSEFESLLIYQMLKTMREAIPKSGFLGNSREDEIYQAMRDQEVARSIASKGGIGLTAILMKQLRQEKL